MDVSKLVVEGLVFRPDGEVGVQRVKPEDNPAIAKQELHALQEAAAAWREVHSTPWDEGLAGFAAALSISGTGASQPSSCF